MTEPLPQKTFPMVEGYDLENQNKTTLYNKINPSSKGNILRKFENRSIGTPFYEPLNVEIVTSYKSIVELSGGKMVRKLDIVNRKPKLSKLDTLRANNSFP